MRWSNKKHKIKKHKPTASSPAEFNRFTYANNNPLSGKDIDGNRPLYSGIRTREFYESTSKSLMPQYMSLLETQSQMYNAEQSTLNQFIQESITTNPFEQPMDLYIDGIRIRPGSAGYSMLLDLAMRGRTDMLGAVTIATYGGLSTNSGVVYDMGALLDIAIENYQQEIIELQTAASKAQSKEELEETTSRPYFDTGEEPPGDGDKKKKNTAPTTRSTYYSLEKINKNIGAYEVGHGFKEETFNYLSKIDNTITNEPYFKIMKGAGKGLFIAQTIISGYQGIYAFVEDNPNKWGVAGKATLDITIGVISAYTGPIGWVAGTIYFIGDTQGWWGTWGEPVYITKPK